jgi:hypothetical protein
MFFSRRKPSPVTVEFAIYMYKRGFPMTLKDGRVINILGK